MHSHISMQQFLSRKAKVKVHSTAFTRSKSHVQTNNLGRSPEAGDRSKFDMQIQGSYRFHGKIVA